MIQESKIHLALLSGIFATGGGIFAKLAEFYTINDMRSLASELILLGAMVTSNTIGCTLFVKALAGSSSSIPATVTSFSVNYVCSAIGGFLLFGETLTWRWWCGTCLVILGLVLICNSATASSDSRTPVNEEEKKKKKAEEEENEKEVESRLRKRQ